MLFLTTLLLSFLALLSPSAAQSSNSSVFVYDGTDGTSVVFALQADKGTGDLYFHLSAPSGNGWVGVGIGYQMAGSLMFVAYASGDDNGVTISPRYATGETEPVYQSNITIDQTGTNGLVITDGIENIVASGVCKSCVTWNNGGSIDLTSAAQAFIFAVGPAFPPLASSSRSAGLSMHSFVGHFTMDMTAATVQSGGEVPTGPFVRTNAAAATNTKETNDPGPHIHGLVMSFVFIILFPLGTLILRVWNSVRYHAVVQIVALVLFCMAVAGGIVASMPFNRSKNYNSAHQIIGFFLLIALLAQLVMGIMHHRVYKKEQRKTIRGWIHLYMGPAIIFFGLINGYLGFVLAQESFLAIPYSIIIIIVGIIYSCIRFFSWRRQKRNAAFKSQQAPGGYPPQQFGQQMPPPNYAEYDSQHPQVYRSQDVPLERYHSSNSVPHVGMPAQEPRTML